MMPEGPWLYPEDQISDAPLRMLAAEITREKIYERLHEELPYQSTVETDQWQQRADGSVRIEQTIFVERESQRKIVLGKGGQTIKAIGQAARKEIAEIAEAPVHLFLFVKVRENWGDDPERYREMGLEFPERVSRHCQTPVGARAIGIQGSGRGDRSRASCRPSPRSLTQSGMGRSSHRGACKKSHSARAGYDGISACNGPTRAWCSVRASTASRASSSS